MRFRNNGSVSIDYDRNLRNALSIGPLHIRPISNVKAVWLNENGEMENQKLKSMRFVLPGFILSGIAATALLLTFGIAGSVGDFSFFLMNACLWAQLTSLVCWAARQRFNLFVQISIITLASGVGAFISGNYPIDRPLFFSWFLLLQLVISSSLQALNWHKLIAQKEGSKKQIHIRHLFSFTVAAAMLCFLFNQFKSVIHFDVGTVIWLLATGIIIAANVWVALHASSSHSGILSLFSAALIGGILCITSQEFHLWIAATLYFAATIYFLCWGILVWRLAKDRIYSLVSSAEKHLRLVA